MSKTNEGGDNTENYRSARPTINSLNQATNTSVDSAIGTNNIQ